ncbi:thioredoxin family protein [Roseateles sp.]|jgi:thiol-disulfide isomerase/thioredoxin|uniref:thioredoxin family protein n=1 Tax=Roseateles sp. TaxID=1971397 RepID=UPI00391B67AE
MSSPATPAPLLVACLCAAWCRVCEGYHEVFAQLRQQHPDWRFLWVDIEDDAELVDDLEVETFPTLLVGRGAELLFLGPVTPELATVQRLLAALETAPPQTQASPAGRALLARLQQSCC